MSYTKQTWQSGDTITAQKLNHIEGGLADGGVLIVNAIYDEQADTTTLDKTWQQIHDATLAVIVNDVGIMTQVEYVTAFNNNGNVCALTSLVSTPLGTVTVAYSCSSPDEYPIMSEAPSPDPSNPI